MSFGGAKTPYGQGQPTARKQRARFSLPKGRGPAVFRTGPRLYGGQRRPQVVVGPGDPPDGFVSATTSGDEWPIYWAVAKITGWPKEARTPPYTGYEGLWSYQRAFLGGRQEPGGAVIDFVIQWGGEFVGLRIQTEYFHVFADAAKVAMDQLQRARLAQYDRVMDIYSQNYVSDRSGKAAVSEVWKALAGQPSPNPLALGNPLRSRSAFTGAA